MVKNAIPPSKHWKKQVVQQLVQKLIATYQTPKNGNSVREH